MAGASQHGYDPVTPICFLACTFTSLAFFQMAPNLNHLLNSSCYSVTYPPSTESSDTNNHSPTGSTTLQQHLSPISDLPPYYPGSQHTLSLDRRNASDTQLSDPAPSKFQLLSSDYPLVTPSRHIIPCLWWITWGSPSQMLCPITCPITSLLTLRTPYSPHLSNSALGLPALWPLQNLCMVVNN